MRIRNLDVENIPETRAALVRMRAAGLKSCAFLRRSVPNWRSSYLPHDLREAYEHGHTLGVAYGDLIDAWEIDNEPDLAFVPESAERYTAFLKATALGLRAGISENAASSAQRLSSNHYPPSTAPNAPLILNGALGLPPGPWLERFAANAGFSYVDGYNYHYYGYAEDFTGVYHQHAAALRDLTNGRLAFPSDPTLNQEPSTENSGAPSRPLPVFLTELGYGMLGPEAAKTKPGRIRQWRWFDSVAQQILFLPIEGPMAFYFIPYLELGVMEYGLLREPSVKLDFSPSDFGRESHEPWMDLIGTKVGDLEVTPALAAWVAAGRQSPRGESQISDFKSQITAAPSTVVGARSRAISAPTAEVSDKPPTPAASADNPPATIHHPRSASPNPVVVDMLPGAGLHPLKRFNGSFVVGTAPIATRPAVPPPDTPPLRPMVKPAAPPADERKEDFAVHIRTRNGNLYEVYPVRSATPRWQHYLEQIQNFTLSFYGRANLPWRLADNEPVSLVFVFYPKTRPTTYEFSHVHLDELRSMGLPTHEPSAASSDPKLKLPTSTTTAPQRYAAATLVLYNFSPSPITGSLTLPPNVIPTDSNSSTTDPLTLEPHERREIPVEISVPADHFTRHPGRFSFDSAASKIAPAILVTEFFPALEGMDRRTLADLLPPASSPLPLTPSPLPKPATEESARSWNPAGFFTQDGVTVTRTPDGFLAEVTGAPSGKEQRVEVEFPLPAGQSLPPDAFLSFSYRLRE